MILKTVIVLACSTLALGFAIDSKIKRQAFKIPSFPIDFGDNPASSSDNGFASSWTNSSPSDSNIRDSTTDSRIKRQSFKIPSIPTNLDKNPLSTPGDAFASSWSTSSSYDGSSNATSTAISSVNSNPVSADSNAISNSDKGFASSFANSSIIGPNSGSDSGPTTTNDSVSVLKNNPISAGNSDGINSGIGAAINVGRNIASKGLEATRGVGGRIQGAINATYQEEKDSVGSSWNSVKNLIHQNIETGANLTKTAFDLKMIGPKFAKNLVLS